MDTVASEVPGRQPALHTSACCATARAAARAVPVLIAVLLFAPGLAMLGARQSPAGRITTAANVTLRTSPAPAAAPVAGLPLGTELISLEPAGEGAAWYHVRASVNGVGAEGWVLGALTRRFDPAQRASIVESIAVDRLARQGDGFAARAELVRLLESLADEALAPEAGARLAWLRWRAMSFALAAIPPRRGDREPYASWLRQHAATVVYDEPGARWMLRQDAVQRSRDEHAGTLAADEIAWLAATAGLPGECEGDLACRLSALAALQGEYLRIYPDGRHVEDAASQIANALESMVNQGTTNSRPREDCQGMSTPVLTLRASLGGTGTRTRLRALAALDEIGRWCK